MIDLFYFNINATVLNSQNHIIYDKTIHYSVLYNHIIICNTRNR